jgi:hypothetical protein
MEGRGERKRAYSSVYLRGSIFLSSFVQFVFVPKVRIRINSLILFSSSAPLREIFGEKCFISFLVVTEH